MKRRCKRTVKSFARRYTTSTCRKSLFYKNRADSPSLSPNPFPLVKDCVCLVGSASCRASGIHARHPCRGYFTGATAPSPCWGLRPSTPFLTTIEVFRQSDPPFKNKRIRHIFTYSENTHVLLYRRQAPGGRL